MTTVLPVSTATSSESGDVVAARGDQKMPQRLGELLVAEKLITADQLEDAIEAQCLYGGRIGTSLIELGYLDEEEIARTLSRKLHLPYIEQELLMKIPSEVIDLMPQKLACKHLAIPCRLEKKRLYLAMSDPTNLTTIDALAFRLGFIIVPVVVPELRLMLALQKYYHLELSPRFYSLSQRITTKRRKTTSRSAPSPKTPGKQSRTEPPLLEVTDEDIVDTSNPDEENWPLLGEKDTLDDLSDAEYQELINMPEHLRQDPSDASVKAGADRQVTLEVAKLSAEEQHPFALLCKSLLTAENRDDIADAIIDYLSSIGKGVALLMVKGETATGWKAAFAGEPLPDFSQLQIPLNQPSILQTVADSKSCYLGPLPHDSNNLHLASFFTQQPPEMVLLMPLLLRGRLVSILYLQETDTSIQQQLPEIQKLAAKAAMAFEMLILKNKITMG